MTQDSNGLKLMCNNTKKEDRVLIENCSSGYQKTIPILNQKYKYGDDREGYVFDVTINIRSQKKGMTTTQVIVFVVTFVVNLRGVKT